MREVNIHCFFNRFDCELIKITCNELNGQQNLIHFKLVKHSFPKKMFGENYTDMKKFYKNISYPIVKKYKLSNLIDITDLKISIDSTSSVSTHFSNSYKIGIIVWRQNSSIPYLKYQLLKMALQLISLKYLQHNNDGCLFDNDTVLSNTALCEHCENELIASGFEYKDIFILVRLLESISDDYYSQKRNDMFVLIIMDIVKYSILTDMQQKAQIMELQYLIKSHPLTRKYRNELIFDPTGDGCIIGINEKLLREAIKYCAAIQTFVKKNGLKVRFGMNYGSVFRYRDINQNVNVAGSGINLAARVMDYGDANHILANRPLYDALGNLDQWHKKIFHNLGYVTVKHGVQLQIYNVFSNEEDFGNSNLSAKLKESKQNG